MRLDEFLTADKHPARTAARVIDTTFVRCQHLNENADDVRGCVELSTLLTLGAGELREKVLVHSTENILGSVCGTTETDIADEVNELTETLLVETRTRIVFWEHTLERRVVPLDGGHRFVNDGSDLGLRGVAL